METIETRKRTRRRASVAVRDCVACGCCVKVCPLGAISVRRGLYAEVSDRCVGCGRCAAECPASVITMVEDERSGEVR